MSASLNTEIQVRGTQDEILAIINVLKYFESEMFEQYQKKRDCAYIQEVRIESMTQNEYLRNMTDEQIKIFAYESGNMLNVEASGPYGYFSMLDEVGLFEAMAEVAPTADFSGSSDGYMTGADVTLNAELREGLLHLSQCHEPDENYSSGYKEEIDRLMPYFRFIDLFKIDEDELEEDDYWVFITNAIAEEYFPDMNYKEFKEFCQESKLNKEEYEAAIEIVKDLELESLDTYRDRTEDERWDPEKIYDPVAKRYV